MKQALTQSHVKQGESHRRPRDIDWEGKEGGLCRWGVLYASQKMTILTDRLGAENGEMEGATVGLVERPSQESKRAQLY